MNAYNAQQSYLESSVASSDPLELTRLLYRNAISSLTKAEAAVDAGDIAARGRAVVRAQSIVAELASALDYERGGEIAPRLAQIYEYVLFLIQKGHFEQTAPPLAEARTLLESLLEAWEQCRPTSTARVGSAA